MLQHSCFFWAERFPFGHFAMLLCVLMIFFVTFILAWTLLSITGWVVWALRLCFSSKEGFLLPKLICTLHLMRFCWFNMLPVTFYKDFLDLSQLNCFFLFGILLFKLIFSPVFSSHLFSYFILNSIAWQFALFPSFSHQIVIFQSYSLSFFIDLLLWSGRKIQLALRQHFSFQKIPVWNWATCMNNIVFIQSFAFPWLLDCRYQQFTFSFWSLATWH